MAVRTAILAVLAALLGAGPAHADIVVQPIASPPAHAVSGPDGNLWGSNGLYSGQVRRLSPTTGEVAEFPVPDCAAAHFAAGADGNVWFACDGDGTPARIGRATPAGQIDVFPVPSGQIDGLAAGADGTIWASYSQQGVGTVVQRTASSGTVLGAFHDPAMQEPGELAAGADGSMWMAGFRRVHRISPSGDMTYIGPTTSGLPGPDDFQNDPQFIVSGSDGRLWVDEWHPQYLQTFVGLIDPPGRLVGQFHWPDANGRVVAMAPGRNGTAWLNTGSVLSQVDAAGAVLTRYCIRVADLAVYSDAFAVLPGGDIVLVLFTSRFNPDTYQYEATGSYLARIAAGTASGTGCPEGPAGPPGPSGGPPPAPGADARAPVATLVGRATLRRDIARVRVRCDEACRLTVRGELRRGARRLRARKPVRAILPAGAARTLRVRFPTAKARRLHARRLRLSITATDAAGNHRTLTRTLRLRRA